MQPKASSLCYSASIQTETDTYRQITIRNVKAMWCRAVAHYFEWVAGIPELRLMDMREKVTLVVRQLCKIASLMVSFWTYRQGHNGIVFGSGICYNPSEAQDNALKTYASSYASVIHNNIISVFRKVAMTREEYLLLKLISFFDPPHFYLRQPERTVVDRALKKYQTALVGHVKHSHPFLDHKAVTERISALLGIMPYLEVRSTSKLLTSVDMVITSGKLAIHVKTTIMLFI
ncbi:Ligand-binding domain of nuclear hormone receptor [Trichostrongylus colubriformis]|uniref:Ligand-binding domain of nuclear hormone receptor n=1 Tax=Trichostrongylus colubriformis TaxID=6319 RepID=A0AAN8FQN9_TRICO